MHLTADGTPAFHILAPAAYDFIDLREIISRKVTARADFIYFGSLAQRSAHGFEQIKRLLGGCPITTRCFCDINLRAPFDRTEVITHCLQQADILKLNDEELLTIARRLNFGRTTKEIIQQLTDTYKIETLALTRAEKGSTVFHMGRRYDSPTPPAVAVRDTVGAGDAFAAALFAGIVHSRPMPEVLAAATDFAAYICGQPGAIPDDTKVYDVVIEQMGATRI